MEPSVPEWLGGKQRLPVAPSMTRRIGSRVGSAALGTGLLVIGLAWSAGAVTAFVFAVDAVRKSDWWLLALFLTIGVQGLILGVATGRTGVALELGFGLVDFSTRSQTRLLRFANSFSKR